MTEPIIVSKPLEDIVAGDQIRFIPPHDGGQRQRWWTVKATDHRYVIASRQALFQPKGTGEYTVIDLIERETSYNNVGPGIVRSSLNTLGGGYDMDQDGWADQMLADLHDGTWELSNRRLAAVHGVEVKG
ncbi:hypothetical protein GCM10009720_16280 [Yaniella flava]|uniref:Uncharacterized protein n=1 Tax=Yaniella flava TaxID=287930 RepID=A0ABN2UHY3_9MICC